MSERPCSKCGLEPRVKGQRWGLKCRAAAEKKRRDAVPRVSRGTSRLERRMQFHEWLKTNRARVEREQPNAICLELRRLGFFSMKTGLTDIRVSLRRTCSQLGIPCQARVFNGIA